MSVTRTVFIAGCLAVLTLNSAEGQDNSDDEMLGAQLVGYWHGAVTIGVRHANLTFETHSLTHRKSDGSLTRVYRSFTNDVLNDPDRRVTGRWQVIARVYIETVDVLSKCQDKGGDRESGETRASPECAPKSRERRIKDVSDTSILFSDLMRERRVEATFELPTESRSMRSNHPLNSDAREAGARHRER